jgi:hypothetical protein
VSAGERLVGLFADACALDPAARDDFLARLRDEDAALAEELASLLAAAAGAAGAGAAAVGATSLLDGSPWQAFDGEPAGAAEPMPAAVGPTGSCARSDGAGWAACSSPSRRRRASGAVWR